MRHLVLALLAWAAIALAAGASAGRAAPAAAPGNLVANGGFESGVAPWSICGGASRVSAARAGKTAVYAGRFSARLGNPYNAKGCPKPDGFADQVQQAVYQRISIPAGATALTISFQYYVDGEHQAGIDVRLLPDLYSSLFDPGVLFLDSVDKDENPGWSTYRRVLTTPEVRKVRGRDLLLAFMYPASLDTIISTPTGKQTIRIDDVSVVPAAVHTTASPRPAALKSDGTRPIAFVRQRGDLIHLWRINTDGSGAIDVYPGVEGRVNDPDWSPGGTLIALGELVNEQGHAASALSVIDLDRHVRHELHRLPIDPNNPGYDNEYTGFAWAPNGTSIAASSFAYVSGFGEATVSVVRLANGRSTDLFSNATKPDWSRKNRLIFEGYNLSDDNKDWGIWQANMAQARPRRTPMIPGNLLAHDSDATWAPDGRSFATVRPTSVAQDNLFNPQQQGLFIVPADRPNNGHMVLVADHGEISNPTWSPDGKFILYNLDTKRGSDIWWFEVATGKTGPLTRDGHSADATWRPR